MALGATQNQTEASERNDPNDIFLVSDLHMADGRTGPFGKFTQGENFFWDESFSRLLETVRRKTASSTTLIVNGDFFDFLRVNRIPDRQNAADIALVNRWKALLELIDHPAAQVDLYAADSSEREYGFKTRDYKSVWRLLLIFEGHPIFFGALRAFVASGGNRIMILKGNHDLELFWEAVRQAFVFFLAQEDPAAYNSYNERITFYQKSVVINGEIYVEHGHLYEDITHADRDTVAGNPTELALPVGSLFNRYVINKLEEINPLFDNIKPPTSILEAVAEHYPSKLLTIVFHHLKGAWRIIQKQQYWYAAKIVGKIVSIALPLLAFIVVGVLVYHWLQDAMTSATVKSVVSAVISFLASLVVKFAKQLLFSGDGATSLLANAKDVCRRQPALKLITFGHTHVSEMELAGDDCWYINSGTWIPAIELETNQVQDTNTFCVLRLMNERGRLRREPLLRWDDERGALMPMIVFEPPSG